MKILSVIAIMLSWALVGNTQLNLKVGYKAGIANFDINNQLLGQYDGEGLEVMKAFGDLNFLHGIQLGISYRVENFVFEVGWENMSRSRNALLFNSDSDQFTERVYDYALSSLMFGVDNYFGHFGLGAALQSQRLGIDRNIAGNDLSLVSESNYSYQVNFIWTVQRSAFVSLVLKPFIQFPLGDYDLTNLAIDLGAGSQGMDFNESLTVYGISVSFYNGRQ